MEMLGPEVCRVGGPPTSRQDGVRAGSFGAGTGFFSWCQTQDTKSLCSLGPFVSAWNGY